MHVCHVINNLEVGGAETMLLKLLARVRNQGVESSVISLIGEGTIGPQLEQLGIRVDCLGMARGYSSVGAVFRLAGLLHQRRPDIVGTWLYQADLVGGLASRCVSPRTPVIWNLRTGIQDGVAFGRTTRFVQRTCASLSRSIPSAILCNSHVVKNVHEGLGYAKGKLRVIPNGFDLEKFYPSNESHADVCGELGISPSTRLIGMMAQFDPRKDHATFLRAAIILCERFSDVHFVLCGTNVTFANEAFDAVLGDSPHRHRFHLLGPRSDMPRLQASLEIGVLASAPFTEGFPNAVGEAMACGVPCVVTTPGGSPEVVGDCGLVVPAGDANALAEACSSWLALPSDELAEFGARSRRRIQQEFSLDVVTQQYMNVWREFSGRPCGVKAKPNRRAA
jgi:glycosyltransferase involved in cell wall biosynthesis